MATKPNVARIYRNVPIFIREMRQQAGLTQRMLAKRIGKSQWWVARCETGSRRIDVAEFVEICIGCNRQPSEALSELAAKRQ